MCLSDPGRSHEQKAFVLQGTEPELHGAESCQTFQKRKVQFVVCSLSIFSMFLDPRSHVLPPKRLLSRLRVMGGSWPPCCCLPRAWPLPGHAPLCRWVRTWRSLDCPNSGHLGALQMMQFAGAKSNSRSKPLMNQNQQAPWWEVLYIRCEGQEGVGQHLGLAEEPRPTAGCGLSPEVTS